MNLQKTHVLNIFIQNLIKPLNNLNKKFLNIKSLNLKYYSILRINIDLTFKLDLIFYRNNEDGKVGRKIL